MDAFELVERIDNVIDGLFLVPCEIEADMLAGLLLIDGLHLIERCNFVQNGCQFCIFKDDRLELRTILLCQLCVGS